MSYAAPDVRQPLDRLQKAGVAYAVGVLMLIAGLVGTGIAPVRRVTQSVAIASPSPQVSALPATAVAPPGTAVTALLQPSTLPVVPPISTSAVSVNPSPSPIATPSTNSPTPLPTTPVSTITAAQTAADFGHGDAQGVTTDPDGALGLTPTIADGFDTGLLDTATWQVVPWGAGGTATVGSGTVTVNIAAIRSRRAFVHRTLEARVRFTTGAQPLQNIAWSANLNGATAILIGEPPSDPGHLYGRVKREGEADRMTLLPVTLDDGMYHTYRIAWEPERVDFAVDGVVQATIAVALDTPMYAWISAASARPLTADWARVLDFEEAIGTLTSVPIDAGASVTWRTLAVSGIMPAGTGVQVRTRTSVDGVRWSEDVPVGNGGAIVSPPGRYVQYLLTFTGTAASTPLVTAVTATAIPARAP